MRLPIQSMQAVRLRPTGTEDWYRSVIVDFEPDRELVVVQPEEKDQEVDEPDQAAATAEPPEGQETDVPENDEYFREPVFKKGTRLDVEISFVDGIRSFNSVVRRLDLSYGGSMRIEWPTEGKRIQRRDYVRVEISSRTLIRYQEQNEEGEGGLKKIDGHTVDFSAGGVRLRLTEPLPADLRIEMEIDHPALKSQALQGRVVRSGEMEKHRNEPQYYWVAVEFVGVDESLRKDLTQLVFVIQREHMRKSLS